jgi:hypothetical protein
MFTERDGRKGPPAGNKAECNCTNTPHSKATRRKAKPNQKPQTHARGERQALTTGATYRLPSSALLGPSTAERLRYFLVLVASGATPLVSGGVA